MTIIGSASRYLGGRRAVQTVYWRVSGQKDQKLVKIGRTFNLKKQAGQDESVQSRYSDTLTTDSSKLQAAKFS